MSATVKKVIEAQEQEIAALKEEVASLKEQVTLLKDEVAALGKALDSKPEVVAEVEPCKIHGYKECANLKCIPTEVEVE